jgi:hypothetical protein
MDSDDMELELLKLAADARKLDIESYLRRSLFFWGFIVAAFGAYALLSKGDCAPGSKGGHGDFERAVLLHFGFLCSLCWFMINSGSKFWCDAWETKTRELGLGKRVFDKSENTKETPFWAWRFSPSRVTVSRSLITSLAWLCMIISSYLEAGPTWPAILISAVTVVLAGLLVQQCKRPLKEQ